MLRAGRFLKLLIALTGLSQQYARPLLAGKPKAWWGYGMPAGEVSNSDGTNPTLFTWSSVYSKSNELTTLGNWHKSYKAICASQQRFAIAKFS